LNWLEFWREGVVCQDSNLSSNRKEAEVARYNHEENRFEGRDTMTDLRDMFIVDSDSHWSEPGDLFTRRAPAAYRDRMPQVVETEVPHIVTGETQLAQTWVFDGAILGPHTPGGVISRDGEKVDPHTALFDWSYEMIHAAAYDPKVRVDVLDECGIDAQIIFPTSIGLGGQHLGATGDKSLSEMAIEIYNDVQAEIQAESGNRLLGMPLMPAWDVEKSIAEAKRVAAMGLRGINMTADPNDVGGPDLADRAWDPFWQVCVDNRLPVHFHIGSSETATKWHGPTWASQSTGAKMALGGAMLFIGNARILANLVVSGVFDRHPDLKVVSVESGVGWIPFVLEAVEYEMAENAPDDLRQLDRRPIEYFRTNMYGTFWFERNENRLEQLVESVGEDNIMFETDFPHPTCLYPDPLGTVADKVCLLPKATQAKIMGENARKLYRL